MLKANKIDAPKRENARPGGKTPPLLNVFKGWYAKKPVIITLLVLFFPVGLPLMWKFAGWTQKTKWIITCIVALIIALGFVGTYYSAPTITLNSAKNNKISTDNAEYELTGYVSSMKAATLAINGNPVTLSSDSKFSYRVSIKEGDNEFNLVATNNNGKSTKTVIIHRTTQAEFASRAEAERLAAEKKAQEESRKVAEAKAKAEKKASNKKTEKEEKANVEAQKPKHTYDEFYEWSTTTLESLYGRATGGTQADRQERRAYINTQCSKSQDIDGDGDKDIYYDKSCLQDKYKEYLKPSAFDYGSSHDNGGSFICPADGERYYSYICSRYGDLMTQVSTEWSTGSGFKLAEEHKKSEAIYNELALTN